MSGPTPAQRELGAILARLDALEDSDARKTKTLLEVTTYLAELTGGRKVLVWLIGGAAGAGAFAAWAFKHFFVN